MVEQVFDAFLTEEWDTSTLEVFLHSRAMLATHASVRCLEFPSDYVEKRGASPWLCTRKACRPSPFFVSSSLALELNSWYHVAAASIWGLVWGGDYCEMTRRVHVARCKLVHPLASATRSAKITATDRLTWARGC